MVENVNVNIGIYVSDLLELKTTFPTVLDPLIGHSIIVTRYLQLTLHL